MLMMFFAAFDYGVMMPPRDAPPRARSAHLAQLGRTLTDPAHGPTDNVADGLQRQPGGDGGESESHH